MTKMDIVPKLRQSASSFSVCLANVILFFVFYSIFLNARNQIPYEEHLLVSDGLVSTSSPSRHPFILRDTQKYNLPKTNIPLPDLMKRFEAVPPVSSQERILCKMLKNKNCHSHFIAENADLVWVLAAIYTYNANEGQFKYRNLHNLFRDYIKSFGFNHITIEAIRYPNETRNPISNEATEFLATQPGNEPHEIQVHYYNVTYIRENLLNVAVRKLDKLAPWEYIMWIDAHHFFDNPYWWEEGIYKSEKSAAVQLFERIEKMDFSNHTYQYFLSITRMSLFSDFFQEYQIVYGNAYILTKDLYNQIGYIYDECIATSCDCAYVLASFPNGVGWPPIAPNYYKTFDKWINHTKTVFKNRRTYVRGLIRHFEHGKLFPYWEIQKMIDETDFDPVKDIGRDSNFSIYVKNEFVSRNMEDIILKSVNAP